MILTKFTIALYFANEPSTNECFKFSIISMYSNKQKEENNG